MFILFCLTNEMTNLSKEIGLSCGSFGVMRFAWLSHSIILQAKYFWMYCLLLFFIECFWYGIARDKWIYLRNISQYLYFLFKQSRTKLCLVLHVIAFLSSYGRPQPRRYLYRSSCFFYSQVVSQLHNEGRVQSNHKHNNIFQGSDSIKQRIFWVGVKLPTEPLQHFVTCSVIWH